MKDGVVGEEHLKHGKVPIPLFQISVGQCLLPENHFCECPGNVWTKDWVEGGLGNVWLIPQCS